MQIRAKCKTTGEMGWLDVGESSRQQVEKDLHDKEIYKHGYYCQIGNHIELSGCLGDDLELFWEITRTMPTQTEQEWEAELRKQHKEVYRFDDVDRVYAFKGFLSPFATAVNRMTKEEVILQFVHSPKGIRYYLR